MPGILLKCFSSMTSYQGLANFSCKGTEVNISGLWTMQCHNYSPSTVVWKQPQKIVTEWVWLCSSKTLVMVTEILILPLSHVTKYSFDLSPNHLKCINHSQLVGCRKGRSGLDLAHGLYSLRHDHLIWSWYSPYKTDAIITLLLHMGKLSLREIKVTCPRTHSRWVVKLGLQPRQSNAVTCFWQVTLNTINMVWP